MRHESLSIMRRRLLGVLWTPLALVTMTFAVLCCVHAHNIANVYQHCDSGRQFLYYRSLPPIFAAIITVLFVITSFFVLLKRSEMRLGWTRLDTFWLASLWQMFLTTSFCVALMHSLWPSFIQLWEQPWRWNADFEILHTQLLTYEATLIMGYASIAMYFLHALLCCSVSRSAKKISH